MRARGRHRSRRAAAAEATAPHRRSTRRGSSRSPAPSTTATTATSSTSSAAGSPPSTVTTTVAPTCSSPAAASRPRSTATTASLVATLRFTQLRSPVTDLTAVTGAYPLDIDGDGHSDLVVLRVGEDVVLRGLGDCRFERANESLGIDGGDTWTAAFSATWEGANALADAGVRRLPRRRSRALRGQPPHAPGCRGQRLRRADRPVTWLLHAVDAVQRLGSHRSTRPADDERPALLPRRVGAAVAGRAGRDADASTRRPTAGSHCRSGAWASPARTSPATAIRRCT